MTEHENPFERVNNRFDILEGLVQDIRKFLKMPNPHERMTRQMVADQYRVSLGTVHNHMKSGRLPYTKIGAKTIFKRVDVEAWATMNDVKT